ncbi:putative peptidyl-prolyl cis-trans isomerase [Novipirellula aureliae]|uniref:peptidylprolyl isomerase n=1 Tax=Novipirellula aureliae TaxID=2527966 RepID=A0A5C6E2I9_9BACT|nr:tandem-95 repeat protein [Novipirellula aureliae]TWU43120.1 putative peptidyl-prolyl cis-trans isomerase [Novipirellula aureliae]
MPRNPETPSTAANSQGKSTKSRRSVLGRLIHRLGFNAQMPQSADRGRLLLESLEPRQLMAGDTPLLFTDGSVAVDSSPALASISSMTGSQITQAGGAEGEQVAEGEAQPDLVQFAKDLAQSGAVFYGASWCSSCSSQKALFEDGKDNLPFVEVTNPDRTPNSIATTEGITVYPTWILGNDKRLEGVQTLETLSSESGVPIPLSDQPIFEGIGNQTVQIGAPLHIPVDAYDPDGGPLTVSVSVDNPDLLEAVVLQGNRSIRIDMETYGDMVFELFEQRAPAATGRIIELANSSFYDGILFHRVIDNFVLQAGDPGADNPATAGTGGSDLGDFDDQFHSELVHTGSGVLSYAKAGDDTNDSQFFITEGAQRFLDFNHMVFGQLVEGEDVREAISSHATSSSRPTSDIRINSIDVFDDTENSVVMLKAKGNSTGTTNVTMTVTDQDGNTYSETFAVAVTQDNSNSQPFLGAVTDPAVTQTGNAANLQLTSTDVEGDVVNYFIESVSTPNVGTISVTPDTNQSSSTYGQSQVLISPSTGFSGPVQIQLQAMEAGATYFANLQTSATDASITIDAASGLLTVTPTTGSTASIRVAVGGISSSNSLVDLFATGITNSSMGSATVNATSGLVTTNAASGFTGTMSVTTGVAPGVGISGHAFADRDTQQVAFAFQNNVVAPPTAVDLAAASDSGVSNSDNITSAASLSFTVSGTIDGATVELVDTNTGEVIGTGAGTGSTITIVTSNIAAQVDGTYNIAARQRIGSTNSAQTTPILVTYDTTMPASVIATAVTQANVGRQYTTDLSSPEEGNGLVYGLSDSPTGATINAATGEITWTPTTTQTGVQAFSLTLTDLAGNTRNETLNVTVAGEPDAEIKLTITDLQGQPVTKLQVGQQFLLNLIGVDARDEESRAGIFAAFADILYDNSFIQPASGATITFTDRFPTVQNGVFSNGLIDEIGAATDRLTPSELEDSLIATVRMEALKTGSVTIRSEPADASGSEVLLYGQNDRISADAVAYGSVTVAIGQNFTVANDTFTVAEDSAPGTFDVLANDQIISGTGTLTLMSVTQPTSGAALNITNGKVGYLLDPDFSGEFEFTYRVRDDEGIQETATVTVTVTPTNDPPEGVDDTFNVDQGSRNNTFDVLANDTSGGEPSETLSVSTVSTSTSGATITIAADGKSIVYTPPASFTGTDTFTYTVSDGSLTDVVDVIVTVAPADPPPTAVDDSFTVVEDAAEAAFDVLANDTRDASNEAFVIDSIQTPSQGGTVRKSDDGTQFFYTPKANFNGTEQVTYTIRDTGGGLSVATVTFTVTAVNDAPPVANSTVNINRGGSEKVVLEIGDLPANVDSGETLTFSNLGTPTAGGTVRIDSATGSIFYTPSSADFTGTDTFTYTVNDGSSLTSSGTITIEVSNFTERDLTLLFDEAGVQAAQISGIMLRGTDELGGIVELPLSVVDGKAVFENILPGNYTVDLPSIPFFSNTSSAQQIAVTSLPEEGDASVNVSIGTLLPSYISIRDWLGSTPRKSLLLAVEPGQTSVLSLPSAATDTIVDASADLDSSGQELTIRGTRTVTNSSTSETTTQSIETTLPTENDRRVQSRGQAGQMRLYRVSVEADETSFQTVTSDSSTASTATTTAEGESVDAVSAFAPQSVTLGGVQAEGESLAASSVSLADVFVPDAVNPEWVKTSSSSDPSASEGGTDRVAAVDDAMQDVASELSSYSKSADAVAENSITADMLSGDAIDAAISDAI